MVAFRESELNGDERIVANLHPHAIVLARSVIALVASIAFGLWVTLGWKPEGSVGGIVKVLAAAAVVASLVYFLAQWTSMMTEQFVVTSDRCVFRRGILSKSGVEIPHDRINTVFFNQTPLERFVRCGSLSLESAGERGIETIEHVRDPIRVQQIIYEQIEANENRRFDRMGRSTTGAGCATVPAASVADEISKLAALLADGHISTEEFNSQKAVLLGRGSDGEAPTQPGRP